MTSTAIPNYMDRCLRRETLNSYERVSASHKENALAESKEVLDRIELLSVQHKDREATESYIASRFEAVHQARIRHFLPFLISVKQAQQRVAAMGIQPGHSGPMFLEQYLSSPVEQQIAALEKQPVSRDQIVEIGNLVVSHKPAGFMLFLLIASALSRAGFKWMTFTATPVVEKMIQRLGYSPFHLAEASAECLGDAAGEWGLYYEKHPRVMVGNLVDAQKHIQSCSQLNQAVKPFQHDIYCLAADIVRQLQGV